MLVRTSYEAMKEHKVSHSKAIPMFLQECIMPHFSEEDSQKNQFFVENEIYQGGVNDIIYFNQDNLRNMFNKFS